MSKPAVTLLIVVSALAFTAFHQRIVLAQVDDSLQIFGYDLRLQLKVELSWNAPEGVTNDCRVLPDTLEVP